MDPHAIDQLPPGARLSVRALAAGASPARLQRLLRDEMPAVLKHLRVAARAADVTLPPPGSEDAELLAALAPVLEAAGTGPDRAPSTRCPSQDVLAALASGALDGPLLLAELDHVADCPACLRTVLEAPERPEPAPPQERSGCLGLLVVAAAAAVALSL